MIRLRLESALGTMRIFEQGGTALSQEVLGITAEDQELFTGKSPWLGTDRARVMRVLDSYVFGTLDVAGLPRFEVPAEFLACVILIFVDPINYFPCCSWATGFIKSEEALRGVKGTVPTDRDWETSNI